VDRAARRLIAILAADVVGYSRLMEADEAGAADRKSRTSLLLRRSNSETMPLIGIGILRTPVHGASGSLRRGRI
jgi:hypothetical protein